MGRRRLELEHDRCAARQLHDLGLGSQRWQHRELGDLQGNAIHAAGAAAATAMYVGQRHDRALPRLSKPGVSVVFTAAAAGCATPEYRFWLLAPGRQLARWCATGVPAALDLEHDRRRAWQLHDLGLGSRCR